MEHLGRSEPLAQNRNSSRSLVKDDFFAISCGYPASEFLKHGSGPFLYRVLIVTQVGFEPQSPPQAKAQQRVGWKPRQGLGLMLSL